MASSDELSDESKKLLQDNLDELSFVDAKDILKDLSCCCCEALAIYHCTSNCKHIFCNYCYLRCFDTPCPKCKTVVKTRHENLDFERKILELKIECKFKKYGCKDTHELRHYLNHIDECKFSTKRLLPKVYKEDPIAKALKQLSEMIKLVEMENKKQKFAQEFTSEKMKTLKSEMSQLRVTSEGSEYENMRRMKEVLTTDMDTFKKEIQRLESIFRESQNEMDKMKSEHKSEIQRLETKIHDEKLALFEESKSEMEKMKTEHQSEFQKLESKLVAMFANQQKTQDMELLQRHQKEEIFMWKISGFKKKWQRLTRKERIQIESEEWFTTHRGLKFKPVLGRFLSDNVYIKLDFSEDTIPSSPFLHSRKFVLLDQRNAIQKQNVELIDMPKFKKNSAQDTSVAEYFYINFFVRRSLLKRQNNLYVKNDEILIQIILEPISILWRQIESRDGVFLWRISDYSQKKKDEIDGIKRWLTSKPFKSSHVMGYTACLRLYLNGDGRGKGKCISICLFFVLGEHDNSLPLPFQCQYEFSLLDQSESPKKGDISQEFNYEFDESELRKWSHEFLPQSTVESSKFLKNDSILIRTTLKMLL